MAGIKTIKITCTLANTAYNVVSSDKAGSATTTAPSLPRDQAYVGEEVTFQNQTGGSTAVVGGFDVVSNAGIILVDTGTAFTIRGHTPSSIQLQEWYVSSSVASGVVVIQLRKHV